MLGKQNIREIRSPHLQAEVGTSKWQMQTYSAATLCGALPPSV